MSTRRIGVIEKPELRGPVADGERASTADRQRQLVRAMSERQAGIQRNAETLARIRHNARQIVTVVVRQRFVTIENAQEERALTRQDTGEMQLMQHSLDAVWMLADILEEEDALINATEMRGSCEMRNHCQV